MPPKVIAKRTFEVHPDNPPPVPSKPVKGKSYTEEHVKMALYACSKSNPEAISIAKAAEKYGIPSKTLGGRVRGAKPRVEAHEDQQLLTAIEERALARFCEARGWRGEPVDLAELRVLAEEISGRKPGERWPYAFMSRHPELRRRWAKQGESKRANALNKSNTDSFFELLAEAREGVDPDCIWNCDEKGIVENGGCIRRRVIVGSDQKDPKVTADESRKMVTVLECVSAAGHAISPLVIHPGAEKDGEWIRSNPCGAS
jgi:helix-turn-helix, Psq domain